MVELLAVIVILGILSAFSVTAILSISKNQKQQNYESSINGLLAGARSYFADNLSVNEVTVDELITDKLGYADLDPTAKKVVTNTNNHNSINDKRVDGNIYKTACGNESYKMKIEITVPKKISEPDGEVITYNDCACEEQGSNINTEAKKLCTD